jgi:OmpA-OmpF porin, OOP family
MKKGRWLIATGLLAAVAAGPAAAQHTGLYAGGSFGYSQSKDICDAVVAGVSCDDNDTAWRAFAGYQFNQYFALELGFANLGEASGSGGGLSFAVEAKEAWDLSALFTFPVAERLSLLLRLGAHRTRATVDDTGLHEAKTGSAFALGAGAEYSFGKVGLRAEWQRYDNVGHGTAFESDIDVFSLGLLFRF